MSILGTADV